MAIFEVKKLKIKSYNKNNKEIVFTEEINELYIFDQIEVNITHKYVDFIDSRYYTEDKFRNKITLAPIRIDLDDIDFFTINIEEA